MKNILNKYYLAFMAVILFSSAYTQTQISGSVNDADNMVGIPGVNVIIDGTNLGTVTDFDGNFSLNTSQDLPLTIVISYVGYSSERVEVTSANQDINVMLSAGQNLEEVVISASRRTQKSLDAPASISIINSREIAVSPATGEPFKLLENTPGIYLQQQGANTMNLEGRSGSSNFSSELVLLKDNRLLTTPQSGTVFSSQLGISNLDLERVEVVRGPAGAVYGTGAVSGVVHFITKSPIDSPGQTISIWGGEMNTLGSEIRLAKSNEDKTFGYKFNFRANTGDDFDFPSNAEEFFNARGYEVYDYVYEPIIRDQVVTSDQGKILLGPEDIDPDGDGNLFRNTYDNYSFDTAFEWRPNDVTSYRLEGGVSEGGNLVFQNLGVVQNQGNKYYAQGSVRSGDLFLQAGYESVSSKDDNNPSWNYFTGARAYTDRTATDFQLQYNFDMPGLLNSEWTLGGDARLLTQDTGHTLHGRNEFNDDYNIYGGYLVGDLNLSEKLKLSLAGRYDDTNVLDDGTFSTMAALVYKVNEKNSFRLTYNNTYRPVSSIEYYTDFPISVILEGGVDAWLYGQSGIHQYESGIMDLILDVLDVPVDIPLNSPGFPLSLVYQLAAPDVLPALSALAPTLTPFFSQYAGPDGFAGNFVGVDLGGNPMSESLVSAPAEPQQMRVLEFGYKGFIGEKLRVSVDVYNQEVSNFTNFGQVGRVFTLLNYEEIATSLAAGVTADLAPIAGPLAPTIGGYFGLGGQGIIDAALDLDPDAFNALGVEESSLMPQGDGISHIPIGYRFFPESRDHWGVDVAFDYYANESFNVFLNGSWVSQNEWIVGESNDDGVSNDSFLEKPTLMWNVGFNYYPVGKKLNMSGRFHHKDSFYSDNLFAQGNTDEQNYFDLNIGYQLTSNLRLDLTGQNIFNNEYKVYPMAPVITRRLLAKITFDL